MVEKQGSLAFKLLNKLEQLLQNEAGLLAWIILILKGGDKRQG